LKPFLSLSFEKHTLRNGQKQGVIAKITETSTFCEDMRLLGA
jgi:hypothetical protein